MSRAPISKTAAAFAEAAKETPLAPTPDEVPTQGRPALSARLVNLREMEMAAGRRRAAAALTEVERIRAISAQHAVTKLASGKTDNDDLA